MVINLDGLALSCQPVRQSACLAASFSIHSQPFSPLRTLARCPTPQGPCRQRQIDDTYTYVISYICRFFGGVEIRVGHLAKSHENILYVNLNDCILTPK